MDMTASEYLKQMTKEMNLFEKVQFLISDTFNSFLNLSIIDKIIFVLILIFLLRIVFWIFSFVFKYGKIIISYFSKVLTKFLPFIKGSTRDDAIKQHKKQKKQAEIRKKANLRKLEKNKEYALITEKQQKERRKQLAMRKQAIADLDYSFFIPENGFPYGPDEPIRLLIESNRAQLHDGHTLTTEERENVKNGLAYDGGKFGGDEYGEKYDYLFKKLVKYLASDRLASANPPNSTGKVVQFKPKQ